MKTLFYQILELYEDAALSHAQHDLTCTETAVLKLGAILNQFAETHTEELIARTALLNYALREHARMQEGIEAWRESKETQNRIAISRYQDFWDAHNQRMADIREEYKQ